MNVSLPVLLTAYARAAETSALARHALVQANLAALPAILQGMGRPMPRTTQAAWLLAVEKEDVLTIRSIAVGLASARVGMPRGPHVALLEAIVDATGAALQLRDLADHHGELGTLPSGAI